MMFQEIGLKVHSDSKVMNTKTSLLKVINQLQKKKSYHSYKTKKYREISEILKNIIEDYYNNYNVNQSIALGNICKIKFPLFSMGAINSKHLFGIDEIIIFCFYFLNKSKYKNVFDLGSNIGLHSLILSKLNYRVFSYEPDTVHFNQQIKNLKLNNQLKKVKLYKKAVSNSKGKVKFLKVLGNTTGNHIYGDKKKVYGKTKIISVQTENFKKIISNSDLIKIDVEGHEAELILSTSSSDWKKTDAIVEVGNKMSGKKIFDHCIKNNLNIFSQMSGWKRVKSNINMPNNHKKGSIFITKKNKMNWR